MADNIYKIEQTEEGTKVCQIIDGWYSEMIIPDDTVIIIKRRINMSLWKLAKSIAHDKSLNVKEVYDNLVQNRKKLRKMEDRVYVENHAQRHKSNNSSALDEL